MTTNWREAELPELPVILASALDVFVEHGYHGASVREIARRANLTMPTLYYHYQNKEGLLRAVLTSSLEPIAEGVEHAAAEGSDAPERLANIVECIVLSMTRGPATSAIDAAESRYLGADNHALYVAVRDRIERPVQEVLSEGVAGGDFIIDDVSEVRRAILGLLQAIPRWYHREGSSTPTEIARRYVRLVLRMVGYPVAAAD